MKRRILIADDEARVRLIIRDSLQKIGSEWEIVTVSNGLEALDSMEEGRFDLMITDVRMPGMNGIELTRAVGKTDLGTRVIWITAYGCHRVATKRDDLEVYRCLEKPIEIAEIRRVVREVLDEPDPRPRRVQLPDQDMELAYAR